MKKKVFGLISVLLVVSLTACGNNPDVSEVTTQNVQTEQESTEVELETESVTDAISKQQDETVSLTACGNHPDVSEVTTQNVQTEQESTKVELETESVADAISKQQDETSQSEIVTTESHNKDAAIELYVNVLRNYISMGKIDFTASFIDLDDDSTREMVVFFGESQADGGVLFTIRNGEAIQIVAEGTDSFGQYGGFTYKEKGNVFVTENESVTATQISNQIFYYVMENGKAICKDMTQSITQFDSDESEFYVNDTEVDSEKFNSIAESYGLLKMSTVSYSDGVRVMNE